VRPGRAAEAEPLRSLDRPGEDLVVADDRPPRVVAERHPGGLVAVAFERAAQPHEPTELEDVAVAEVERDLVGDLGPFRC
jgi:hypothetical protein